MCTLLQLKKLMGSTNPSLNFDGFGRTHRTHANATTVTYETHEVIKKVYMSALEDTDTKKAKN